MFCIRTVSCCSCSAVSVLYSKSPVFCIRIQKYFWFLVDSAVSVLYSEKGSPVFCIKTLLLFCCFSSLQRERPPQCFVSDRGHQLVLEAAAPLAPFSGSLLVLLLHTNSWVGSFGGCSVGTNGRFEESLKVGYMYLSILSI